MKFSKTEHLTLDKVGAEHRSWKSKLDLEQFSNLVSIERSIKEGHVKSDHVATMLNTSDWMPTESYGKGKVEYVKEGPRLKEAREEPFERFPQAFNHSPVRRYRRGYYAPWAQSDFALTHISKPTNNKSRKQIYIETLNHRSLTKQREHTNRLHGGGSSRSLAKSSSVPHSLHSSALSKAKSLAQVGEELVPKGKPIILPPIKQNR